MCDPVLFSVVGVVVGPFVGVAASWRRATGVRAALGTALPAALAAGGPVVIAAVFYLAYVNL